MAKNIVLCCDGTGNEFGDQNSNVVKLYSTLLLNHEQAAYYHPGVGTMGSPQARGRLERTWTRLKGLAFGAGLIENVADAYRYLMNTYADGDRIFLFGFSRGAYTARVLGGVLQMFGLLCPGNEGHIPYVMRMYAERRRHAHRRQGSAGTDVEFKYTFSRDVNLHLVGVWDTVCSVGWIYDPIQLPFSGHNPLIKIGRQAIAIDERRSLYQPMLWEKPESHQDIKQVWFTGVHSDVGGSYPEHQSGLSKVTLGWMLNEAVQAGLLVDPAKAACVLGECQPKPFLPCYVRADAQAPMHCSLKRAWWLLELLPHKYEAVDGKSSRISWRIPFGSYRQIPESATVYEPDLARIPPDRLPKHFVCEPAVEFNGRQLGDRHAPTAQVAAHRPPAGQKAMGALS